MKNLILSLLLAFSGFQMSAQSKINSADFGYYYIFNNRLFDIRTNKPIFPNLNFQGDLQYNPLEKRLYHLHSQIQKFDESGKMLNTIETNYATLSMDLKTAVYSKDGDVWTAKVDANTGKLTAGTKVTQLGIFNDYIPVINWYENVLLVLAPDNNIYLLSLSDGQMKKMPIDLRMLKLERQNIFPNAYRSYWSPTKRYVLVLNNTNTGISTKDCVIDMKAMALVPFTSQITPNEPGYDTQPIQYWVCDSIALLYSGNNVYNQGGKFYWFNVNKMATELAFYVPKEFNNSWAANLSSDNLGRISKCLSANFSYLLLPLNQQPNTNDLWFSIYSLKNSSYAKTSTPLSNYYLFGTPNYYEWVTDSSFLFRQNGDITTQGTWLYNVKSNEKKKISTYLLDKAIALPKAGKFLFIANQLLYSANFDGSDIKQVSPEKSPQFILREFTPGIQERAIPVHISKIFSKSVNPLPSIPIGRYVFISNKTDTNLRINVENGLAAGQRKDGDWSAQWTLKPVPNSNYFWIENRWKTGERLHIESGILKSEKIKDDAWSANWELIQVGDSFYIQNRWKKDHKIHLENGKIECSAVSSNAKTALWKLKVVD
jgi:hypothetical protein